MFDKFFPDRYVASTYVIDFEGLYKEGVRGLIFDIDNTLVPHGAPADERARALFKRLKSIGFRCCLISNNQKPRVEMFNKDIQVDYVYNAHKPSTGIISGRWRLWEQTEGVLCLSETSFLQMYGEQNVPESRIFW